MFDCFSGSIILTPEIIATLCGTHQPNKGLITTAFVQFSSCPGDGENGASVGNITLVDDARGGPLGLRIFCDTLLRDLHLGVRVSPPAGETTVNFIFWTFCTSFSTRDSGELFSPITGRTSQNCISGLKKVAPAYGFDVGNVGNCISDILGPFLGFLAAPSLETCECIRAFITTSSLETSECPSENNFSEVSADGGHAVASKGRPVNNLGWRRIRWLKRRSPRLEPNQRH